MMEINFNSFALQQSTKAPTLQKLSEQQQQSVSDILSEYHRESLTAEQASEIAELFQEQNIAPSAELAELVADAGFNAQEIGALAGIETPEQGRPPSTNSNQSSTQNNNLNLLTDDGLLSQIEAFIAILEDTETTQEQRQQTFNTIREIFEQSNTDGLLSIYT